MAPQGWWPYPSGPASVANASEPEASGRIDLAAVPYFAWANRQDGAMRVWLPAV
jgi:DUF1680 family protein